MNYEMVGVFRNKKSGAYIVQPMARRPIGGSGDFGEPIVINAEEFDDRIVPVVLENLATYSQQQYNPKLAQSVSDEEDSKFRREHDYVSVLLDETGLVEVKPCKRVSGGYVSIEKLTLRREEIPEKLAEVIREAFHRAC